MFWSWMVQATGDVVLKCERDGERNVQVMESWWIRKNSWDQPSLSASLSPSLPLSLPLLLPLPSLPSFHQMVDLIDLLWFPPPVPPLLPLSHQHYYDSSFPLCIIYSTGTVDHQNIIPCVFYSFITSDKGRGGCRSPSEDVGRIVIIEWNITIHYDHSHQYHPKSNVFWSGGVCNAIMERVVWY